MRREAGARRRRSAGGAAARTAAPAPARCAAAARSRACRRSWGSRGTGRRARCRRGPVTTRPSPVRISISSTDSCGSPLRNDVDSMPSPVDRAAQGDRLELRHDQRHQPVRAAWRRPGPRRWSCRRRRRSALRVDGEHRRERARRRGSLPRRAGGRRNRLEVRLPSRTGASRGQRRVLPLQRGYFRGPGPRFQGERRHPNILRHATGPLGARTSGAPRSRARGPASRSPARSWPAPPSGTSRPPRPSTTRPAPRWRGCARRP